MIIVVQVYLAIQAQQLHGMLMSNFLSGQLVLTNEYLGAQISRISLIWSVCTLKACVLPPMHSNIFVKNIYVESKSLKDSGASIDSTSIHCPQHNLFMHKMTVHRNGDMITCASACWPLPSWKICRARMVLLSLILHCCSTGKCICIVTFETVILSPWC